MGNKRQSWENCHKWFNKSCPHRENEPMRTIVEIQKAEGDTLDITKLEKSYEFCSKCNDYDLAKT